jgi:hypothetical protein
MQSPIFHLRPDIKSYLFTLFLLFYFHLHANAALYDRGNGLIYDDILKVTWLQDASYAKTSGDHISPWMSWNDATAWVDQLTYLGYTDWRLPKVLPINGQAYDLSWTNNGSKDQGYNISAPGSIYAGSGASELAFMFYNNLNNQGWVDLLGNEQPDENGLKNKGPFVDLNPGGYWSLTDYALSTGKSLNFNFFNGVQETVDDQTYSFAWAVRDGDIAAVPIPSAAWLLGSGFIGFVGIRRRLSK